ncbi:hypothetical protein [uncultured Mucilaginibacter sp.]|uniref:hypothetical protein n=1 Tax=uncultured Mucilaginibacter sp. TaxID=797541 RepID=UPI0025E87142|nr:hypothetical protein [uncultured Mucilaginibacter sp.]
MLWTGRVYAKFTEKVRVRQGVYHCDFLEIPSKFCTLYGLEQGTKMKEQGEIKIEVFPTFSPLWLAGCLSRSGCFPKVSGQAIIPLRNDLVVKWREIFLTFSPLALLSDR